MWAFFLLLLVSEGLYLMCTTPVKYIKKNDRFNENIQTIKISTDQYKMVSVLSIPLCCILISTSHLSSAALNPNKVEVRDQKIVLKKHSNPKLLKYRNA